MKPFGVVEPEIFPEAPGKIPDRFVVVQVEPFVLERAPEAFNKNVIKGSSPAIHADSDIPFLQWSEESLAGELASLVGIEDLRLSFFKGSGEGFNAKRCIQGVRKLPGKDKAAVPVNNGDQIHKAFLHSAVGDVRAPYLIGAGNLKVP